MKKKSEKSIRIEIIIRESKFYDSDLQMRRESSENGSLSRYFLSLSSFRRHLGSVRVTVGESSRVVARWKERNGKWGLLLWFFSYIPNGF